MKQPPTTHSAIGSACTPAELVEHHPGLRSAAVRLPPTPAAAQCTQRSGPRPASITASGTPHPMYTSAPAATATDSGETSPPSPSLSVAALTDSTRHSAAGRLEGAHERLGRPPHRPLRREIDDQAPRRHQAAGAGTARGESHDVAHPVSVSSASFRQRAAPRSRISRTRPGWALRAPRAPGSGPGRLSCCPPAPACSRGSPSPAVRHCAATCSTWSGVEKCWCSA